MELLRWLLLNKMGCHIKLLEYVIRTFKRLFFFVKDYRISTTIANISTPI